MTESETSSRKPIATTSPNERSRSITNAWTCPLGLGLTRQIVFSATCSSRNAPVAATRNVMPPMTVARMPARPLAGALEKALHGQRALASDQMIELADDLPAHGLGTEHHARDRRGDQQDRRDREQRVIGERRAEPRAVIIPPGPGCGSDQSQDHRPAHEFLSMTHTGSPAAVQLWMVAPAFARAESRRAGTSRLDDGWAASRLCVIVVTLVLIVLGLVG